MDVRRHIDINCDIGEGFGQDALLFPYISSGSIACGGHIGDEESMKRSIELALESQVQIGAHPSYPDRENFGRKKIDISVVELFERLGDQYSDLEEIARKTGANVAYLKPHGALYHSLNQETELFQSFIEFVSAISQKTILGPPNSILKEILLDTDIAFISEGFADRTYTITGNLSSRNSENALIINPEAVCKQVRQIIFKESVTAIDGNLVPLKVQSICLHSDTPSASASTKALNKMFLLENIERRHF